MFRKFLLTGLPLILNNLAADSDELSLAVGLLASMLGMVAYAAASPFADQQDSLLMLPTQMQVTLVMVCGMLMKFVDGDPVGQLCIAFLVIASCLPILGFGVYLPAVEPRLRRGGLHVGQCSGQDPSSFFALKLMEGF